MTIIYLVRHGQSLANAGGLTMEHATIPLTKLGHFQAAKLAELLPQHPSQIGVSSFLRAQQTAQAYSVKVGIEPKVQTLLREFETIDPALLEGMNGEQRRPIVDAFWQASDPQKRMGEKAETFNEFVARVLTFHQEVLPTLPNGSVLFGHGMWIALLAWHLLGFATIDRLNMKAFRRFQMGLPMPNGAVYRLEQVSGKNDPEWIIKAEEKMMRTLRTSVDAP